MLEVLTEKDFDSVFSIMEQSFPLDEYRTRQEQKALLQNPDYTIYGARDEESGRIKGFLTVWNLGMIHHVEHFAVASSHRNEGLGSRMLSELVELLPTGICLEVEPPEDDMAVRRIGFYQRCGLIYNDYPYIQPAMSAGRKAIPLKLMTWKEPLTPEAYEILRNLLYRKVYGCQGEVEV